jgi:hypothetical protein
LLLLIDLCKQIRVSPEPAGQRQTGPIGADTRLARTGHVPTLLKSTLLKRRKAMNYMNTFIQVAPDCPVTGGTVPVAKSEKKPIHVIQYELLSQNPYKYTQEDVWFEVYLRHKSPLREDLKARGDEIRTQFFQKSHPCLRSSTLPKKYGWGIHFDKEGKAALYGMETEEYLRFTQSSRCAIKQLVAFRNKRAK